MCCREHTRCWHVGDGAGGQPTGVDRPGGGQEEAQTLQQVPDPGAGERVPLQRLCLEAEALGVSAKPQPLGASGENMVPEQADEEQKEQPTPGGPANAE